MIRRTVLLIKSPRNVHAGNKPLATHRAKVKLGDDDGCYLAAAAVRWFSCGPDVNEEKP